MVPYLRGCTRFAFVLCSFNDTEQALLRIRSLLRYTPDRLLVQDCNCVAGQRGELQSGKRPLLNHTLLTAKLVL